MTVEFGYCVPNDQALPVIVFAHDGGRCLVRVGQDRSLLTLRQRGRGALAR